MLDPFKLFFKLVLHLSMTESSGTVRPPPPHTHMHTHAHTCMHACMHACARTHKQFGGVSPGNHGYVGEQVTRHSF